MISDNLRSTNKQLKEPAWYDSIYEYYAQTSGVANA